MNCSEFDNNLDDWLDGMLEGAAAEAFPLHARYCENCAATLAGAERIQRQLATLGRIDRPVIRDGFFAEALAGAAKRAADDQRRRHRLQGFGAALAAGIAIVAVTLFVVNPAPAPQPGDGIPSVTFALEEPRTVNLVFAANEALDDATLTVSLPDGVAIQGFEGRRELTWTTTLSAGRNVLPLTLIASAPTTGELLATLRHGNDDRTFRIQLNVQGRT
jgi:anti-sigma factor RsiW